MSEYTLERIEEFLKAANSDLGSTKYRPNVLITDYANCVTMGQQMLRNINAKDKRIAELEGQMDKFLSLAKNHYWDSLEKDKAILIIHIETLLRMTKARKGCAK